MELNSNHIISKTASRITEISKLILDKKLYSDEFKNYLPENGVMDKDWSEAIYETIDNCPYKFDVWIVLSENKNLRTMRIGNSSCYEVWAEFTTRINGKIELSDMVIDLEYNTKNDKLIFVKVFCP